jgi:hypothetical protein
MPRFLSEKNELDLQFALAAMAVFPTLEDASAHLLKAHGITVSPAKLEVHRRKEAEQYGKVREQMQPLVEKRASSHIARPRGYRLLMADEKKPKADDRDELDLDPEVALRGLPKVDPDEPIPEEESAKKQGDELAE